MVSWQVPYLAKGCRPDFNNGLRSDSNSGPILPPCRLFESDSNNGHSLGHLNLVSDGATSVHVSYLWFPGRCHIWPRAAGLTSIMASEVTRIVVPFCPPAVYSSLTRITATPWAISILCQMELHLFMSPTYGFLAGAILAKGSRPDFNNGLRGDSNSGPILAPGVYSSLTRIMASPQAIPILNCKHELAQKLF